MCICLLTVHYHSLKPSGSARGRSGRAVESRGVNHVNFTTLKYLSCMWVLNVTEDINCLHFVRMNSKLIVLSACATFPCPNRCWCNNIKMPCVYVHIYIYIYMYIHTHMCVYIYIYICIHIQIHITSKQAYTTAAAFVFAPGAIWRAATLIALGCGLMGSTLMGSLQKYYLLTDLGKNTRTTFSGNDTILNASSPLKFGLDKRNGRCS